MVRLRIVVPLLAFAAALAAQQAARPKDVREAAKAGPNAIRAQKELIRDWERMSIADAVQQGIRAVAAAHGSDETKGLMQAFLQRKA